MESESRSARLLQDGHKGCTSSKLPALMDALMFDVITGAIPMIRASVACKVAAVAIKARGIAGGGSPTHAAISESTKSLDVIRDEVFGMLDGKAIKPALIAAELSVSLEEVLEAIDHEWFDKTPQGIRRAMA